MPSHFLVSKPPLAQPSSLPQSTPSIESLNRRLNQPYLDVGVLTCVSMLPLQLHLILPAVAFEHNTQILLGTVHHS